MILGLLYKDAGWGGLLFVPVIVIMIAALLTVATLFVVVIVKKPRLEPKIYFFGQLIGTIAIIGYPAYKAGYSSTWHGNIENNRTFAGKDSVTMIAFRQLEAQFSNKDHLALESIYTYQQDTANKTYLVFFLYFTPRSGNEYLTSKHIIGAATGKMIYFNLPYTKNKELQEWG